MQLIPYLPIPKLKVIGVSFFLIGVSAIFIFGVVYHFSGEVVAEADLVKPLPKTQIAEQAMQATSQAFLQNKMNQIGLPTYKTDDVETLDLEFYPVHLAPEMGNVTFTLEVKVNGIIARNNNSWVDRKFISTDYTISEKNTNQIVFNEKKNLKPTANPDERNHHAEISINGQDKKVTSLQSWQYQTVTSLIVSQSGDFVLRANIKKFKFAYPIDSIKLVVKKGMIEKPSVSMICILLGMVFCGAVLSIMGTPPNERKALKRSNSSSSKPF